MSFQPSSVWEFGAEAIETAASTIPDGDEATDTVTLHSWAATYARGLVMLAAVGAEESKANFVTHPLTRKAQAECDVFVAMHIDEWWLDFRYPGWVAQLTQTQQTEEGPSEKQLQQRKVPSESEGRVKWKRAALENVVGTGKVRSEPCV